MENLLFLDFETKDEGLNGSLGPGWPYKNKLKVLGFSWSVDQSPPRWSTDIKFLKNLIKSSDYIVAHNASYELGVLEFLRIDFSNKIIIDTVILAKLYNNNLNSYSLNYLGKTYLNDEKFEEEFIKIAEELKLVKTVVQDRIKYCKGNMDVVYENFPEVVIKYANQDVELLIKLYRFLSDKLKLNKDQVEFYSDLLKAVHKMRKSGVVIDVRRLLKNIEKMSLLYEESRELLIPFLGEKNPKSNKDIAEYLIEKGYNLPRTKPSKTFPDGQPSATKQWLSVQQGEFFELLLQFRKIDKILNTFLIKTRDMLLEAYNLTVDELREIKFLKIYPEIVPFGAPATGRFSSRNPNIQQQSKRDPVAKELVRTIFCPDEGEKLYSLDVSAQEPRLTLHYGALRGDKVAKILSNKMINDPNFDLHQEVANLVGIERDAAKTINLGLAYGMGLEKLAKSLKLSIHDAKSLLKTYHEKSPFIKKLTKETESVINNRGFIKTILGRSLRRETAIVDGELVDFSYKALNKLIQGSAADQTMAAIVFAYRNKITLKFTIHDEIVISTDKILDVFKLKFIMENVMILGVPSKTDVKVGENFGELSDFEENLSDSDQLEFNKFVDNFIPIVDFSALRRELKNVRN